MVHVLASATFWNEIAATFHLFLQIFMSQMPYYIQSFPYQEGIHRSVNTVSTLDESEADFVQDRYLYAVRAFGLTAKFMSLS